jgi:hypothetical protein
VWNTKNGKHTTRILSMAKVETQIPHVKNLLTLKLYLEIGKRILLAFKNQLMIATFFVLNDKPPEPPEPPNSQGIIHDT